MAAVHMWQSTPKDRVLFFFVASFAACFPSFFASRAQLSAPGLRQGLTKCLSIFETLSSFLLSSTDYMDVCKVCMPCHVWMILCCDMLHNATYHNIYIRVTYISVSGRHETAA